jgi:N-acetylgalactosamine kinase
MTNNPFGEVKYEHPYLQYFFAGYMAGIKEIKEEVVMGEQLAAKIKNKKYQGLKILVEGNVPIASGLSSSSSFCVCSALLSVYANSLTDFTRQEDLIGHIIKYERMVGTACGGMDQSISVLGIKQACLYIQFKPIRSEKV